MLHAFSHKKSRLYRRYLELRDDPSERRVGEEDEITSMIMGPLAFLSPAAIGAFWLSVAQLRNPTANFRIDPPTNAVMRFWPSNNGIEPDLRVDLSWGSESLTLLVEFKWRAGLSSEDQLKDQWEKYLSSGERARAQHIFIGRDTSAGANALARRDVWQGKLLLRSWTDILTALDAVSNPQAQELGLWAAQLRIFFSLLGIHSFKGFASLPAWHEPEDGDRTFFRAAPRESTSHPTL